MWTYILGEGELKRLVVLTITKSSHERQKGKGVKIERASDNTSSQGGIGMARAEQYSGS